MSDSSHAVPVWAQIVLALIAMVGTIVVAYLNRPVPAPDPVQPAPLPFPPPAIPSAVAVVTPSARERAVTDVAAPQSAVPVTKPRSSLQALIGLDIAVGDDMALLKSAYPDMKWRQVKTILLGEMPGRFVNKVPGKITARVEDDKLTTVWFEMRHDGGTVKRTVNGPGESAEEKVRNEYDTDYSYSQATNMCVVTDGLRSDIIKILGAATQFDEETAPPALNDENTILKYVGFEKFNAKYKVGDAGFASVKLQSEAYIKNDKSSSGYINTKTSHRECSLAVIFGAVK